MKFHLMGVILCVPIVYGSFAYSIIGYMHNLEDQCAKESGIGQSQIELIRTTKEIPNEPQMNNFAKCMLKTFKIMQSDGSINPNVEEYTVPRDTDNLIRVAPSCNILTGQDAGRTAGKVMSCYLQNGEMLLAFEPKFTTA